MRYIEKLLSIKNIIKIDIALIIFNIVVLVMNSFGLVSKDDLYFTSYIVIWIIISLIILKIILFYIIRLITIRRIRNFFSEKNEGNLERMLIQLQIASYYIELINSFYDGKVSKFKIDKNDFNLLHINKELFDISNFKSNMNEEQLKTFNDLKTLITLEDLAMIEAYAKKMLHL
ncbi:MAG: hypothetical protein ACI35S_03190 [Anaeroplasma sp.]